MKEDLTKNITVSIQVLPAHKFIGVRNMSADNYCDFWKKDEEKYNRDRCNEIDGVLSSIKSFNGMIGAWFYQDGKRGFMYGIEVPANYAGEVPEGMECVLVPESPYTVFHHPPYDYATMEMSVDEALDKAVAGWNPAEHGYMWRDGLPTYQRHNPVKYGQAHLRALKKLK